MVVEPSGHLARGERLWVAIAPWAVSSDEALAPQLHEVVVDTHPRAGAWAAATWPADSTHAVPIDLPFVAVRFDGLLEVSADDVYLEGFEGRVAGTSRVADCGRIGWPDGSTCVRFEPAYPLARGARYRFDLAAGLADLTGAPVGPLTAEIFTAAAEVAPVTFVETPCTPDEEAVGPFCVFVDDSHATLRVTANGPARLFARVGDEELRRVASRGEASFAFDGLPADTEVAAGVSLRDLEDHLEARIVRIRTAPTLPAIDITEVRSDPLGAEPAQEYVELLNSGAMPIDLAGYALADREDREGDVITRAVVVPAGGRVLLVSDAFDPLDPLDGPVPGGVPLVRLGTSLGSGGLSNAGEPLFLRDPEGQRVSAAPAVATGAGRCLARKRGTSRSGEAIDFLVGECTPGRPP